MIRKIALISVFIAAIMPAMAGEPVIYNQSQLMIPATKPNHIMRKTEHDADIAAEATLRAEGDEAVREYVQQNYATMIYVDEADAKKADLVNGVVPDSQIPAHVIVRNWGPVPTPADLITLTDATVNDRAFVGSADPYDTYYLVNMPPTTQSNWVQSGGGGGGSGGVQSVNNLIGPNVVVDLPQFPGVQNALDDKANAADVPALSSTAPVMDGTASSGTAITASRGDHRHPSDTTKANLSSPTFTGTPRSVTPVITSNDTSIATTAFVKSISGNYLPLTGGTITGFLDVQPSTGSGFIRLGQTKSDGTSRARISGSYNSSTDLTDLRIFSDNMGFYSHTGTSLLSYSTTTNSFSTRTMPTTDSSTSIATTANVDAKMAARTISTTAPLTGGGNLSANRTLAITAATAATATASGTAGSVVYAPDNAAVTVRNQAATPATVASQLNSKITYGTTAMAPGASLATGVLYFQYQ